MIGAGHITVGADHMSGALPITPPTNDLVHEVMIGCVGDVQPLGHLGGIIRVMGTPPITQVASRSQIHVSSQVQVSSPSLVQVPGFGATGEEVGLGEELLFSPVRSHCFSAGE